MFIMATSTYLRNKCAMVKSFVGAFVYINGRQEWIIIRYELDSNAEISVHCGKLICLRHLFITAANSYLKLFSKLNIWASIEARTMIFTVKCIK